MLWARTVTFDSVSPGDRLPIVIKWETEEAIRRSNAGDDGADEADDGLEEGEEFLNPAVIRRYAEELLLRAFPPESVEDPARRLELEMTGTVAASDTVSLSGVVVEQAGGGWTRAGGVASWWWRSRGPTWIWK